MYFRVLLISCLSSLFRVNINCLSCCAITHVYQKNMLSTIACFHALYAVAVHPAFLKVRAPEVSEHDYCFAFFISFHYFSCRFSMVEHFRYMKEQAVQISRHIQFKILNNMIFCTPIDISNKMLNRTPRSISKRSYYKIQPIHFI